MRIRTGDTVEVISGDDRGVRGKVLRLNLKAGKAVVEGVNKVKKHMRRSQKTPQGGILSREMPVPLSNVLLVCDKCGRAARIGVRSLADGAKERFCRKCGAGSGQIGPSKSKKAK